MASVARDVRRRCGGKGRVRRVRRAVVVRMGSVGYSVRLRVYRMRSHVRTGGRERERVS